jgi:hypothetical protein
MGFGSARPLVLTAGWAAGSYLAAVALHLAAGGTVEISARAAAVCFAGVLYTNLFEYAWHRFGMHSRRPDPRHAAHHRIFYGEAFQTRRPEALLEIVTGWHIFPLLLAVHYAAFVALFPPRLAPAFFLGVAAHFVIYEVTHWYTHVAGNGFDRFLARVPGLNRLRTAQIHHHRLHHAQPMVNFNFNPPYSGDRITGVLRR